MKSTTTILYFGVLIGIMLQSCQQKTNQISTNYNGYTLPYTVLKTMDNGTEIRNGGYGSAMVSHPSLENHFYCMTDRGPNADFTGKAGDGKMFPIMYFSPRIGHFRLNNDGKPELVKEILFKNPNGQIITGRPNPMGRGSNGEIPYNENGVQINFDDYGIDGEGLAAMNNGDFWVSDEYGPHMIHFSADGYELERISPFGINTGDRKLPAVLKNRRPNRGMEGITITPNQKTLVGIMQSTLYNPNKKKAKNTNCIRLISFDIETAKTKQFLYRQEQKWNSNSEITALSDSTFLVLEHDTNNQKHIYKIDISQASDVSGNISDYHGKTFDGKTIEQLSWTELESHSITPVKKTLVADLVQKLPNKYPHKKLEGLWLIDNQRIGIINDDDFAVDDKDGKIIQKINPKTECIDGSTLYIIDVKL